MKNEKWKRLRLRRRQSKEANSEKRCAERSRSMKSENRRRLRRRRSKEVKSKEWKMMLRLRSATGSIVQTDDPSLNSKVVFDLTGWRFGYAQHFKSLIKKICFVQWAETKFAVVFVMILHPWAYIVVSTTSVTGKPWKGVWIGRGFSPWQDRLSSVFIFISLFSHLLLQTGVVFLQ